MRSIRTLTIIFLILAAGALPARADFTSVWTSTETDASMHVDLGDCDGDGDLDQIVSNKNQANRVYRNDGGNSFTISWSSTETEETYSAVWGDYDNDGDLDQLIAKGGGSNAIRVYTNDGSNSFSLATVTNVSGQPSDDSWLDYDADGDLDVVHGNYNQANNVYRNDGGGTFTLVWGSTESEETWFIEWGDYNNDSLPDILTVNNGVNRVYKNNGDNTFTSIWASTESNNSHGGAWGDYDGDNDLDFLIAEWGSNNNLLYKNNGDDTFSTIWTAPNAVTTWKAGWGDYDGDGDLDQFSANGTEDRIYSNDGSGNFSTAWTASQNIDSHSVSIGDIDSDGDLDYIGVGENVANKLWINNLNHANTTPSAPSPTAEADDTIAGATTSVTLEWSAGSDAETTDADLLTYDLCIGTTTGDCDVYAGFFPWATAGTPVATGFGNAAATTSYSITLATGTYYWSVRTVDTTFKRSAWSTEDEFDLLNPVCGNGTVETGEQCDDSNTTPGDGCSATCQYDLVGYWKLDEASGTAFVDEMIYGNDGTIFGTPDWVDGLEGTALNFAQSDKGAEISLNNPDVFSFTETRGFSVSVWAQLGTLGTLDYDTIVGRHIGWADQVGGWNMYKNSAATHTVTFQVRTDVDWYKANSDPLTDPTKWYHFVGVFQGNEVKLYINDVLQDTTMTSGSFYDASAGARKISIGAYRDSSDTGPFGWGLDNGAVDELKIFAYALTESEITDLFSDVCGNALVETGEQCDDGNTTGGDGCSATCQLEDTTPPAFAGVESVTGCGSGCLELGWSAATDAEGSTPITYNIYMSDHYNGQNFATPDFSTSGTSIQISPADPSQGYFFVVRAEDSAGNEDTNTVQEDSFTDIFVEDFSSTPAFTSLWPSTVYWDSMNEWYYLKVYDNLDHQYWAYSDQFSYVPASGVIKLEFDLYTEEPDYGTYPRVCLYGDNPETIDDPVARISYAWADSVYKKFQFTDMYGNDYKSPTALTDQWYNILFVYNGDTQKLSVTITQKSNGSVFYEITDQPFILDGFRYISMGYYNQPDYGDYAIIFIDNMELARSDAICGNTDVETGETCDDGNMTDGDGCSHKCQLEDTTPPAFAGVESVTGCGSGCLELWWPAATDTEGGIPISYNVYVATTSGAQNFSTPEASTQSQTVQVTGLTDGTVYYFVVRAEDALGNEDTNTTEESRVSGGAAVPVLSTPTPPGPANSSGSGFYLKWQAGGVAAGDRLGRSVARAGDMNGDGISEIIIGAWKSDPAGLTDAGSAFVYDGATGNLVYQKDGGKAGDALGLSLSTAGDINGDGNADFIISAKQADSNGTDAGSVYVFDGATGNIMYKKNGISANDQFGRSVSTAGDVNNDGYSDFIVGAQLTDPGSTTNGGSIYVYDGATGNLLYQKDGASSVDQLGAGVASAGDVNGDGYADFMACANRADPGGIFDAGAVYIYDGATGNLLYQKNGTVVDGEFGILSLSTAGDINGDGSDEFIIGAHKAAPGGITRAGTVFVYDGATGNVLYQKEGTQANEMLGTSVSTAGDIDSDGTPDFIAGSYSGSVHAYDGSTGNLLNRKDSVATDDHLGYSVSTLGDIDGDGKADFIAGAPYAAPGGLTEAGSVYVFATDFNVPTVTDNQAGDDTVYSSDPGAVFDVDFTDTGGAGLEKFEYTVWSGPAMSATQTLSWTTVADTIAADSYTTDWSVDFASLPEGTNYVSVRAWDYASNTSAVATDVFYVKKDQSAPAFAGVESVTGCGSGCLELWWPAATDTEGSIPITYNVYMATTSGAQNFSTPEASTQSQTVQVTGLTDGTVYYFVVRAEDALGNEDTNTTEESRVSGGAAATNFTVPTPPTPTTSAGSGIYLKWQADGSAAGMHFGRSVSQVGDMNGDGKSEIIVGAWMADPAGLTDAGSAFIYDGATGNLIYQKDGETAGDQFGISVSTAGDMNNDGYPDFIIGAKLADSNGLTDNSSAYVYDGSTGKLIYKYNGASAGDDFGVAVSTAGDVNNDGYSDLIIGAHLTDPGSTTNGGSIYVYDGATGNLLYQKDGASSVDQLGAGVASAGDVNGDSYSDFMACANRADPGGVFDAGSVYIYDGATGNLLYQKNGTVADGEFGVFALSTAGDINGDGSDEFIIGAPKAQPGGITRAGTVFVYDGATGNVLYQKEGTQAEERLGTSVSTAGDITGDGIPEFIAGSYAGSVHLYDGATGDLLNKYVGVAAEEYLGYSISTLGDINDDGKPDYIAGALKTDPGGLTEAGSVYVFATDFNVPTVTDNQAGDDTVYSSDPGAVFDVDFTDTGGAGLEKFEYTVWSGPAMSATETISWATVADAIAADSYTTDWSVDFASLPEGTNYVSVRAWDYASNTSAVATDVFYVKKDQSAPAFGGVESVTGCGSGCLELGWSAATDAEGSTPLTYNIYQATTSGAQNFATPDFSTDGIALEITGLTTGQDYYYIVRAEDAAGNEDSNTTELSKYLDNTPPDAVIVYDGSSTGVDIDMTASTSELSANWTAATDTESGIAAYYYSIGTSAGAQDTLAWTAAATATAATESGLALTPGATYYFNVKSENGAGLESAVATSDGVTVYTDAPESAITSPADGTTLPSCAGISGTAADNTGAGVAMVEVAISRASDGAYYDGAAWATAETWLPASGTASWSLTGGLPAWQDGESYTIRSRATDNVGNVEIPAAGSAFTYDASPPDAISTVNDGAGADEQFTGASDTLYVNWSASSDPHSGVEYYYYAGTSPGASDAVALTSAGSSTSATCTGLSLTDNATYYFTVIAANGAGLESDAAQSDGVTADRSTPAVEITSPAAGSAHSGAVTVTGTITDATLTSWQLYYGAGAQPAEYTQLASGTAQLNQQTLHEWDTTGLAGSYTLKLEAADQFGRTTSDTAALTIGNTDTVTGTITKFRWTLISAPVHPAPSDPLSMFGPGSNYKVYRYYPTVQEDEYMDRFRYPPSVVAGDGFWIKSYYDDLSYSYTGALADRTVDYTIDIYDGWNQIGDPYNEDYPWAAVGVRDGAVEYTLAEAAESGLISTVLYSYDPAGRSWVQNDIGTSMAPQTGYDVRAYKSLTLVFDPEADRQTVAARIVRPVFDFRAGISAAAAQSADTDNYFGAAQGADEGYDYRDAEEPPRSIDEVYTSLYFHGDGDVAQRGSAQRFANDIRPPLYRRDDSAEWDFTVETSEAGAQIILSWNSAALPSAEYSFTLIDIQTGARIDMAAQDSYMYTASGAGGVAENRFCIQVVKLHTESVTRTHTLAPGWNLISVPLEPELTGALEQLGDDLPLLQLYQYYDGSFYASDSADIQAGIGYWVHVESNTEIDVTGISISPSEMIEVPLKTGWNLIGNPFGSPLAWSDNIKFETDGGVLTLSEAIAEGITSGRLFEYSNGAYNKLAPDAAIEPWKGYFIRTTAGCALILGQQ